MNLIDRWKRLMSELGLSGNNETYESLISAYSESHRYYHDLGHLKMVLTQFAKVERLAENKGHVELALWFHDVIYKPFSSANEQNSAKWASEFLESNGVAKAVVKNVSGLVMATSHLGEVISSDEKLIVDIDLAVLGQSKEEYEKYLNGVRQEYWLVPSFIYRKKRKAILQSFLERGKIYYNETFNNELGTKAHRNLLNDIKNL